jgi:hypothetical protein
MPLLAYMTALFILLSILPTLAWGNPSISWSGPQDVEIGADPAPGRGASLYLDMNSDGLNDFLLTWTLSVVFEVRPYDGLDGAANQMVAQPGELVPEVQPLESGHTIGESLSGQDTWVTGNQPLVTWNIGAGGLAGAGSWLGVERMFMGVQFDAADGVHYGWIRMTVPNSPYSTIHDWAYNTVPGQGIEMGVVPEPSTVALFGLGLVVMLVRRIRGR